MSTTFDPSIGAATRWQGTLELGIQRRFVVGIQSLVDLEDAYAQATRRKRMAENIITAHYDKQASDYMKRAGENAKQADNATSPEAKQRYWNLALDYFNKAINAFDTAKAASSKPKK